MSDFSALGNFKGVMLCNRPAQIPGSLQTVVGPTATSGPTRPAFVSAVVPDTQLGLPPVRHARVVSSSANRAAQKARQEDVTWRHKKWLGEFAERRQAIAQVVGQKAAEQAARRQRFTQRSQAMRDTIRGIKSSDAPLDEKALALEAALSNRPAFVPTEYVDVSQQYPAGAPQLKSRREAEEEKEQPYAAAPAAAAVPSFLSSPSAAQPAPSASPAPASHRTASKPSKPAAAGAAKPGWARSVAEDDALLDQEAEELLEFVGDLDYNKYIEDLEVREAIKFVAERVKGLEASKQTAEAMEAERQKLIAAGELEEVWVVDETQPPDAEGNPVLKKIVRRARRQQKQALTLAQSEGAEEWDASTNTEGGQTERSDAAALSKTVLDSNRHMRNIHSSASVRAMLDKEAKAAPPQPQQTQFVSATSLRRSQLAAVSEAEARPPLITTIYETEGGKMPKGPNPSNLPFLYRHPGI